MTQASAPRPDPAPPASPEAPVAPRQPRDVSVHGDARIDDYFWLRDRDDPRTLAYLKAENAYAEAWLAPRAALKETLYQEMLSRIQQDDDSVPYRKGGWWYSSRDATGRAVPALHLRRRAVGPERRYDPAAPTRRCSTSTRWPRGQPFLRLGVTAVSPDASRLAYSDRPTGGRDYTLHVKDLASGAVEPWSIAEVASAAWGERRPQPLLRDDGRGQAGEPALAPRRRRRGPDRLLYEEADELFDLGVGQDARRALRLLGQRAASDASRESASPTPTIADAFALRTVFARRADIEYSLDHRDGQLLRADQRHRPQLPPGRASTPRQPDLARRGGADRARATASCSTTSTCSRATSSSPSASPAACSCACIDLATGGEHTRSPSTSRRTASHASGNAEFETSTLPLRLHLADDAGVDLRLRPGDARARAAQAPAGARRLRPGAATPASGSWPPPATAPRCRSRSSTGATAGAPAPQPLLLYGYGSYGIPIDPRSRSRACRCSTAASSSRSPTSAAAATSAAPGTRPARWRTRQNTFTDFIACAEKLVAAGRTTPATARHRGRQRRRAADGRGGQPAARAVQGRRRRGAVRRRRHHHARRDAAAHRRRVHRMGQPEDARAVRAGCAPTAPTTT